MISAQPVSSSCSQTHRIKQKVFTQTDTHPDTLPSVRDAEVGFIQLQIVLARKSSAEPIHERYIRRDVVRHREADLFLAVLTGTANCWTSPHSLLLRLMLIQQVAFSPHWGIILCAHTLAGERMLQVCLVSALSLYWTSQYSAPLQLNVTWQAALFLHWRI